MQLKLCAAHMQISSYSEVWQALSRLPVGAGLPVGDVHLVAVVQRQDELLEQEAACVLAQSEAAAGQQSSSLRMLTGDNAGSLPRCSHRE